jgi:hypothetical protein
MQLDLFGDTTAPAQYDDMPEPAPVARARRDDPESSKAAAAEMNASGAANAQRQQVIDAVWKWPGRSSKELAELDGVLDRYQFARRLPEAEESGEIHRRESSGKNKAVTWFPGRAT